MKAGRPPSQSFSGLDHGWVLKSLPGGGGGGGLGFFFGSAVLAQAPRAKASPSRRLLRAKVWRE